MSSRYSSSYHRFKGRPDDGNEYINIESNKRYPSPYYYNRSSTSHNRTNDVPPSSAARPQQQQRQQQEEQQQFRGRDRSSRSYHQDYRHVNGSRAQSIADISRSPSVSTHDLDIMLDSALGKAHISMTPPPPPPYPPKQQQYRSPSPAPRISRTRHDNDFYENPTSRFVGERKHHYNVSEFRREGGGGRHKLFDDDYHRSPRNESPRRYDRNDDVPSHTSPRRTECFDYGDRTQHRPADNGAVFEHASGPYHHRSHYSPCWERPEHRPAFRREDYMPNKRTEFESDYCDYGHRPHHDDPDFRFKNRYDHRHDEYIPENKWYDHHHREGDYIPDNYDSKFFHEREKISEASRDYYDAMAHGAERQHNDARCWENMRDHQKHNYERDPPPSHHQQVNGEATSTETACPPCSQAAQPYSSTINITLVGDQPLGGTATRQVSLRSSGTMTPPVSSRTMSDWRTDNDRVPADFRNATSHQWH